MLNKYVLFPIELLLLRLFEIHVAHVFLITHVLHALVSTSRRFMVVCKKPSLLKRCALFNIMLNKDTNADPRTI